jgi:predicted transcriptional regulator YheO
MLKYPNTVGTKSRRKKAPHATLSESALILREARKIVVALGRMFAPCCEVVLHDLTRPEHSVIAIECPLSGRKVGDSATEMLFARIKDLNFPDVVQNYPNSFPDGRPAKSTSIGIRNSNGRCIAAICLNMDVSLFSAFNRVLGQLTLTGVEGAPVSETLRARTVDDVRQAIERFAAQHNSQPRALAPKLRRELINALAELGLLRLRGAVPIAAEILGLSRASIYNALNK